MVTQRWLLPAKAQRLAEQQQDVMPHEFGGMHILFNFTHFEEAVWQKEDIKLPESLSRSQKGKLGI